MPRLLAVALASSALLCATAATAKEIPPGGLRVCDGERRCLSIWDRETLRVFSDFFYHRKSKIVPAPRRGAPLFRLEFDNGYLTGVVGSGRLDRFRSNGIDCHRFRRGRWYRLPPRAVAELRALTAQLEPLRAIPPSMRRTC